MVSLGSTVVNALSPTKFMRNYRLTIEISNGEPLVIKPPFTVEFDITRNNLSSLNVAQFRIYNLNAKNRNNLFFNSFNSTEYRTLVFQAGYGDNLPICFFGNITTAFSVREGTNFISQIECFDGGFGQVNGAIQINWNAGDPVKVVILKALQQMNQSGNLKLGWIGPFAGVMTRGGQFSGNGAAFLYDLMGGAFYIDSGQANVLGTSHFIPGVPALITGATGLLQTPALELSTATFEMLFEPSLQISQLVQIASGTTNIFAGGAYKITGIKHQGIISDAVCGRAITKGTFLNIPEPLPSTLGF